jgi:O-antigen ligase
LTTELVHQALTYYPLALGVLAALALLALTAWRPAVGCGIFAFSISLTTGLGRGTLIPLLRPNEAILLVLLAGLMLHYLPRRERRPLTGVDLAVGAFTVGVVMIGLCVLLISHSPHLTEIDTLRSVLSPVQFLLVYLVFSRTDLSSRAQRAVLNLTMLASIVVGLIAVAELLDLPGVRTFVLTYYPPPVNYQTSWDPGYRPMSTLGHFSAVGGFATLNFALALTLATIRQPGFPKAWLSLVMAVNLAALVASLTWAPLIVLPFVAGVILWYGRRVPRQLAVTVVALAIAFAVSWPAVSARVSSQGVLTSPGEGFVIPASFAYRLRVWEAFFAPALADHIWLGTGTVIPSEVPTTLINFVDNEYLAEGFRAGLVGLALLFMMLVTIAVVGWRSRASMDPMHRSLGALAVAVVVFFALIGFTSEYMFFGGVSQELAMLIGLLSAKCAVPHYATSDRTFNTSEVGKRAAHSFIAVRNAVQ